MITNDNQRITNNMQNFECDEQVGIPFWRRGAITQCDLMNLQGELTRLRKELEKAATELAAARPIVELMRSERFKVFGALQLINNYDDAIERTE